MKTNKLDKNTVIDAINEQASIYSKKINIYEQVKELNEELKNLYENGPIMRSFGFKAEGDAAFNNTKTGFKNPQNISYISQLEQEMNEEANAELNEVEALKNENQNLKNEIEILKKNHVK